MGLADAMADDRRQRLLGARRRMLATPLVHQADEPELFSTLLAFREELARWFMDNFGWRLVVDASGGFARLRKVPARADATRPAVVNDVALSPRKYTLVLLACAALDEQPGQTTLAILSEAVRELSATEEAIPTFDPHNRHSERMAFAGALKWLEAQGVVAVRDGSLDDYRRDPNANALLHVNDRLVAQLLSCPTSPALVDDPADVAAEVHPSGPDGRAQRAGHHVRRRLADDPVVYYDELDDDERAWFGSRWRLVHQLAADLGLVVERRAEGLAAIDPDTSISAMTDVRFPRAGSTASHAALLVAEHLSAGHPRRLQPPPGLRAQPVLDDAGPAPAPAVPVPDPGDEGPYIVARSQVVDHVRTCIGDYARRCGWASWVNDVGGAARLADEALEILARFRLVTRSGDVVVPRPAIARFAVRTPDAP